MCVLFLPAGLNTCIGQANYASFFRTLLTLCVMEVMHFTVQLYLVIDIFLDGPTRQRAQSWIFGSTATVTILLFFICFNTVSIFLIGQLLQFHRALQRNNLTTYEYIVKDHQSKRARARLAGDLESRRVVLMAEAEQENQRVTVCRLQWGGVCRQMGWAFCDPLDMPQPVEPDPQAGFAQALGGNSHNGPAVNHKESSSQQKQQQRSTSPSLLLDKNSSIPVDFDKELEDALRDTENSGSNIGGEHPHQLVDLMHEVGLPTTSAAEEERNGTAAIKADRTYNYHGDDGVEVDTNDNILPPVTTTTTKSSSTRWTPQSSAMDHDETMRYPIPDPDDSSYLDGNVEMFDNEPNHKEDDASFDSGCSGRSHRSNRSSGNNHANGHNSSYGERDYTAF